MSYFRILTAASGLAVLLSIPIAAQNTVALASLLERGSDYVAAFAPRVSGVILEEQYMLIEIGGGRMTVPERISSDVVLIDLNGKTIALRDTYAIDTKPKRERTLRINDLLEAPTTAGWQLAQQYAQQSQFHFRAEVVLAGSEPTLALQFLAAANQSQLTYRLDGRKKLNGVEVTGIRFQEPTARDKQYLLGTRGNAAASGRFWIDAATGAVHHTELWLESPTETARVQIAYAPDAARGFLLPQEMTATFEQRVLGTGSNIGGHNTRQAFECTAKYSDVRHRPIDLTKIK